MPKCPPTGGVTCTSHERLYNGWGGGGGGGEFCDLTKKRMLRTELNFACREDSTLFNNNARRYILGTIDRKGPFSKVKEEKRAKFKPRLSNPVYSLAACHQFLVAQ